MGKQPHRDAKDGNPEGTRRAVMCGSAAWASTDGGADVGNGREHLRASYRCVKARGSSALNRSAATAAGAPRQYVTTADLDASARSRSGW